MSQEILVELFEMPSCGDPRVETAHNPVLRQVNEMVQELEADGVKVVRHVLSDDMRPFTLNAKISTLMRRDRLKALPITM
ncbi:MAG TPA: arsenic metallochaperone ArsD family protein, partial [Dehalococcoidia bacterium]|nr:arsenic metallochaperone ArsD family protein [Dehalococcoidia bacterium]